MENQKNFMQKKKNRESVNVDHLDLIQSTIHRIRDFHILNKLTSKDEEALKTAF